jgi:hypothetical protein
LFAALPEETIKISVLAVIALRARDFDEPMDGVVYGTAVGLGFAALENLLYVVGSGMQWETVAIMRGVLSVPLHGALGAVAGAYIARARFGGALGAHSRGRWRRPRLFLLAWLIPLVLHGVFDASVFSLRNAPAGTVDTLAGAVGILLVALMALVVGFGAIVFAALLGRRIARRQKASLQTKRLPPAYWRKVWAQCLIGLGLSFVALTLVIAGNTGAKLAGCALMAVAAGMAWKCGRYLNEAAKNRHRSVAAAS